MTKGVIFYIKRYAIHDEPGIRTTVFLKGCPMRCWWWHNSEGQNSELEHIFRENRCIDDCTECLTACKKMLFPFWITEYSLTGTGVFTATIAQRSARVNDTINDMTETGDFLSTLNAIKKIRLLTYHKIGTRKYKNLNKTDRMGKRQTPSKEKIKIIKKKLENYGFEVKIGG